jgi:hypothetical protein
MSSIVPVLGSISKLERVGLSPLVFGRNPLLAFLLLSFAAFNFVDDLPSLLK